MLHKQMLTKLFSTSAANAASISNNSLLRHVCVAPRRTHARQLSSSSSSSAKQQTDDKQNFFGYSDWYFGRRLFSEQTPLRPQHNGEWPKITLFGDSITRLSSDVYAGCWASMLRHKVADYFDVDARGFSGYTTRDAVANMRVLFPSQYLSRVELFVEFFGHNDSWECRRRGVPCDEFEENYKRIVAHLLENGLAKEKILLVSAAWYDAVGTDAFMEKSAAIFANDTKLGKSLEYARKYNDAKLRVARQLGVECLDFFEPTASYVPLAELFVDGIHFSRKGAELMFDALFPRVEQKIAENYGKPLPELYHLTPLENRPEIRRMLTPQFVNAMKALSSSYSGNK